MERFIVVLVLYFNQIDYTPLIKHIDYVQHDRCNCRLHILLNIKYFIYRSNQFLNNPLRKYLNINIKIV